jgi:L-arabinokinase
MSSKDGPLWPPVPQLVETVAASPWFTAGDIVVARAPGRLDVMGGIADYTGSLVCEMPLKVAAAVAVQTRGDGQLICISAQTKQALQVSLAQLDTDDPLKVRALFQGESKWARYVAGCAWWIGQRTPLGTGVTIAVDSQVPLGGGVSSSAAVEVATMTALSALLNVSISPLDLAVACQAVENHVVGAPCGVMDQVTSAMGQEGALIQILCQRGSDGRPAQVLGELPLPSGCEMLGIYSGVSHDVSGDPYTDTRVAAFMGEKILSAADQTHVPGGYLANVCPEKFCANLTHSLPERMTGEVFIDRYERTADAVTKVDPGKTYMVRAATTHHVLEAQRVRRFVSLIESANSAAENEREHALREAGQLMYESHDSYGQCARLGHPMTDRLVALAKELGPQRGFYGAKITGGGGGGTVAFFVRASEQMLADLEQLRQTYQQATGRSTTLLRGTSPGAAAFGTRRLPWGLK